MTAGSLPPAVLKVRGPSQVEGSLRVPGDKSVSHRALLLSALAGGDSTITGISRGDDVTRTRRAIEQLGAGVIENLDGSLTVAGGELREPEEPLDHGNSGTGIRLMSGIVAGLDMFTVLTGDEFLRRRPMDRVAAPLRAMGALVEGRGNGSLAPLAIRGGGLRGIDYVSPVASAQIKSAVLLAGLHARTPTMVREPTITRRHTEEMLRDFGVDISWTGTEVRLTPGPLKAQPVTVPGDPSQAAFWVVAGLVAPESSVVVEDLYLGAGRTGFVDVLRLMGATIETDAGAGSLQARRQSLHGIDIDPATVSTFIDEVPVLAVAAAVADGTTVLSGAEELRVKESDRITAVVAMLKAFGVKVQENRDGMVIEGGRPLRGAEISSLGDHRIAMAAAIAALCAEGETVIHGWEAVSTSYPGFAEELNRLTNGSARAEVLNI